MKNIFLIMLTIFFCYSCGESQKKSNQEKSNRNLTPLESSVLRGKKIYSKKCVSCHMANGKGVPGAFPPLNPSDWLMEQRIKSIHAVKYGLKGKVTVNGKSYNNVMLPLGLNDQQVADVMNYTIQEWNSGEIVTVDDVKAVKK